MILSFIFDWQDLGTVEECMGVEDFPPSPIFQLVLHGRLRRNISANYFHLKLSFSFYLESNLPLGICSQCSYRQSQ